MDYESTVLWLFTHTPQKTPILTPTMDFETSHEGGEDPVDVHKPFTKAERIDQLAEIDHDITLLLTHTGLAIQSLAQPVPGSDDSDKDKASQNGYRSESPPSSPLAELNPEERLAKFKTAMTSFMSTLHSVDVRLKRQIWALEEAGIVTLKGAKGDQVAETAGTTVGGVGAATAGGAGAAAEGAKGKTSLEPNGVGKVGGLDVGWLNSRSNKVEREMESELWTNARNILEGITEGRIQVSGLEVQLDPKDDLDAGWEEDD